MSFSLENFISYEEERTYSSFTHPAHNEGKGDRRPLEERVKRNLKFP
jgi:hypothetical protein